MKKETVHMSLKVTQGLSVGRLFTESFGWLI